MRQNPNALYPQKVTKVQFDSQKVVFISMSSLFVCDSKTGDFLWNDKRIPMPKMEENLTSSDDAITKQNNNNEGNNANYFEAVSTQESNANYNSGSQPSSQNYNNNNNSLGSPVQRKLNFNEVAEDYEETQYAEETNENNELILGNNNGLGDQGEADPNPIEQNFGFGARNEGEAAEDEESTEEGRNILNMSLDNVGEPSLRSPLFKGKSLKRKRGLLNESLDDFESPIKRIKTTDNKDQNNNNADDLTFPNLESTPTKRTVSPKKQRNVRSPSLALLEEEDELDDIIYNNTNEENDSESNTSGLGIFKQEPEAHFADAYETFHFDDNILAVTLAEAP